MVNVDNDVGSVSIAQITLQCRIFRINMTPEDNLKDMQTLNKFLLDNKIVSIKEQFVTGKVDYWLVFVTYEHQQDKPKTNPPKEAAAEKEDRSDIDEELLAKLKQWRNEKCRQLMLPAYIILNNKTAEELAKTRPTAYENLDKIKGIGEKLKEKYGSEIIDLITNHRKESAR